MPQDDVVLRKSLDAVDRRKWTTITFEIIALAFAMTAFLRLGGAFGQGADIQRLLQLSIVALVFWTSALAAVVVLQMSAMTRKILRAIELASRPDAS